MALRSAEFATFSDLLLGAAALTDVFGVALTTTTLAHCDAVRGGWQPSHPKNTASTGIRDHDSPFSGHEGGDDARDGRGERGAVQLFGS